MALGLVCLHHSLLLEKDLGGCPHHFDWLKSQKLDNVRKLLKDQLLRKFLEMKGNIYLDLIRVVYTDLKFEGNNLVSYVKGVDMEITHDVWIVVAGLKYTGLRINKEILE